MDNLAHTLAALALARTPLGRAVPRARTWLIVGANLPDLDIAVRLIGSKQAYLAHHRGITHGLFGLCLQTLLLALLARAWNNFRNTGAQRRPGVRAWLSVCAAGLFSHPVLDALNSYGWRPWLPFDGRWVYGDALFIVDPWLWSILGALVLWCGPPSRRGRFAYAALTLFALGLVGAFGQAPQWFWWTFPAFGLSVLALDVAQAPRRHTALAGAGAALLLFAYVGWCAVGARRARAAALEWAGRQTELTPVLSSGVNPIGADPTRFEVLLRTAEAIWIARVEHSTVKQPALCIETAPQTAALERAWNADSCAGIAAFARFPLTFRRSEPDGEWFQCTDARYAREPAWNDAADGTPRGHWCSGEVFLPSKPRDGGGP